MDDTEDTRYNIIEDSGNQQNGQGDMSTEIRFEITGGSFDPETKEKTVRSKLFGTVKAATDVAARTALRIGLEVLLAKLSKNDEHECECRGRK